MLSPIQIANAQSDLLPPADSHGRCCGEMSLAPAAAAAVGYNANTFSADFTLSNVDLTYSGKSGYAWYLWNLFSSQTKTSAIVINADNSVTLMGDVTGPNGELMTATASYDTSKFVGTAFGGGAYIEAVFKFDPANVAAAGAQGWPAFWALPLEASVLSGADQWIGEAPGYRHSVEVDFFEYNYASSGGTQQPYGATIHDWYGIPNVTCSSGLCQVPIATNEGKRMAPSGTDFNGYHRYGFLWVPATPDTKGYAEFYLDGQAVGPSQQWEQYTDQLATPVAQPWAFGRIDQQHLVLIVGTGPNEPMAIQSVKVWQGSAAQNLHN
jgi:hypothetical protein